jgi:beta-galactosidase/beta-glucuronidase
MPTLRTRWADDVDPQSPLPDYPRPQLRRPRWINLNGPWACAVTAAGAERPAEFAESILVPFPMGSELSGMERPLLPDERLWMHRGFDAPALGPDERLLLNFGAVDWECEVWCNEQPVGAHRGGFDPFSFDITEALILDGPQALVIAVTDPTDTGTQPLGKQTLKPFAIQYPAVAGIWQTVWLEPVPGTRVSSIHCTTSIADDTVTVHVAMTGGERIDVTANAADGTATEARAEVHDGRARAVLRFDDLHLWSPDDAHLYDLTVTLFDTGSETDVVDSYFGAREIDIGRDHAGVLRLRLNGEPVFHFGTLDQGWWPDGLYTAPTDEALAFDIEATRAMGFNTIRKHVKVEPARWYQHADRIGMLVWQDMPSTRFDMAAFGTQMAGGVEPPAMDWSKVSPGRDPECFRRELDAMIEALRPFPSIVMWVPFNESWGQHDTDATLAHVAELDPTRLVDGPSGWVDRGSGQIRDHHVYNKEAEFPGRDADRPVVYGEYGGFKLMVDGHVTHEKGWGYSTTRSSEEFAAAYAALTAVIGGLIDEGLAGAIYTQTTDVESEINGLLTYDREIWKIPAAHLTEIHSMISLSRPTR